MNLNIYLLLIFLCLPYMGNCSLSWKETAKEKFSAEATWTKSQISIEENLEIKLFLTFPSTYHVAEDQLLTNLLKHPAISPPPFKLAFFNKELKNNESNATEMELSFGLEPLIPGKHPLTFFNIDFIVNQESENADLPPLVTLISEILYVDVAAPPSALEATPKLQSLLTFSENLPIEIDENNRQRLLENPDLIEKEAAKNSKILKSKTLPWEKLLIGLFLTGFLFACRKYLKDLLKEPRSPQELALIATQKIINKIELLDPRNASKFYADLSDIARELIENRYQLDSLGFTTQEFINKLTERSVLNPSLQTLLSHFLQRADRVKFAKDVPSQEECQEALRMVKSIE